MDIHGYSLFTNWDAYSSSGANEARQAYHNRFSMGDRRVALFRTVARGPSKDAHRSTELSPWAKKKFQARKLVFRVETCELRC